METRRQTRIKQLTQALRRTEKLHLKEAAQLLDVSEMTIRRDLGSEPAAVMLVGGYIVINPKENSPSHYFLSEHKTRHINEKSLIGAQAAALIKNNDVVFFDCGTTTPFIIDAIPTERHFTAVCYSLNTLMSLQQKPHCNIILSGGEFLSASNIFRPLSAENVLRHICPTLSFISAAGVDLQRGASCFSFDEVAMKHQAMAMSEQNILVCDSTKFDKVKKAHIGALETFDMLITDHVPVSDYLHYCKKHNVTVLCARATAESANVAGY